MKKSRKAPWRRKRPAGKHTKLTPAKKQKARSRAARAGRPYPNLVDNIWAASSGGAKKRNTKRKTTRKAKKTIAKKRKVKARKKTTRKAKKR